MRRGRRRARRRSFLRRTLRHPFSLTIASVFLTLAAVELLFLSENLRLAVRPVIRWAHATNDPAGSIQYDEKVGVRLSEIPGEIGFWTSRHGWLFKNELRGNNFGFSDPKNFSPRKRDPDLFRFIVMGDSFTANLYLNRAWPEVVHQGLADEGVEIYNMAIDGSGVPTWWRILKNVIIKEDFEADAIVLAICCDNMHRHHYWLSDTNYRAHDAPPQLAIFHDSGDDYSMESIRTPDDYSAVDQVGGWPVFEGSLPGHDEMRALVMAQEEWEFPFVLSLLRPLLARFRSLFTVGNQCPRGHQFSNESFLKMIDDFKDFSRQRGIPLYGIDIASAEDFETAVDLFEFDEAIDFSPMNTMGENHVLPIDGHWNEEGARVVGETLTPVFREWARAR